jgi:hypothetical protein
MKSTAAQVTAKAITTNVSSKGPLQSCGDLAIASPLITLLFSPMVARFDGFINPCIPRGQAAGGTRLGPRNQTRRLPPADPM